MKYPIQISGALALPLDVATQSIGVVAQRGSGKTYLAAVLVEELFVAQVPVCVLDPVGVFYGLRLGPTGTHRGGYDFIILGGERGDLPLTVDAGKAVAEWIATERRASILDLSTFRKGEQRQFVTDFAEELYRRNRQPLHLVLDEADLFAPQRPLPGEQRMLGAFEDLVRRGRVRGIGITLVTQRPAVIHKDLLSQVSVLVAMRLVGPQDVRAVDAWIQSHGTAEDRKRVLNSLPGLPVGEAWFWSPGWLGILERIKVRTRRTYDSSKAPAVGAQTAPIQLDPIDLEALKGRLAEAVERAKADDPRELKRRIAALEREVATAKRAPAERVEVSVPLISPKRLDALRHGIAETLMVVEEMVKESTDVRSRQVASARDLSPPDRGRTKGHNGSTLPKGERVVLTAIVQHGGLDGVTREQLTVLTGYKRSSRDTYLQKLRERACIATGHAGALVATEVGVETLGDYEPLPTGTKLLTYWRNLLPEGERRVLDAVVASYPMDVTRDRIDELTGYKRSSRDTYLQKLRARRLVEDSDGRVIASRALFDEA